MLGTRERMEQASLEGAKAFRIEMGLGIRFGPGPAAESFWGFWEFPVGGRRAFPRRIGEDGDARGRRRLARRWQRVVLNHDGG